MAPQADASRWTAGHQLRMVINYDVRALCASANIDNYSHVFSEDVRKLEN